MALGSGGSINSSSGIAIAAGANFNVSAVSSYALHQNLSMTGAGTATVSGAVNASSFNLTLPTGASPGPGILAFSNNLSLGGGGTLAFGLGSSGSSSDQITIGGSAVLSGTDTINVAQLGSASAWPVPIPLSRPPEEG